MTIHVVYYAFDAEDWCLYVGCTSNLTSRLRAHRSTGWYRDHLAYIATSDWMPARKAFALEAHEIYELSPPFNVIYNGARLLTRQHEADERFINDKIPNAYLSKLHDWLGKAEKWGPDLSGISERCVAALKAEIALRAELASVP